MLTSDMTSLVVPAVLWCLILLSVITWVVLALKLIQYARARRANTTFRRAFWEADGLDAGESISERTAGPMARIAASGFGVVTGRDIAPGNRDLAHKINRGDRLERAMQQQIDRERRSLENGLVVLASFGSTSPFIGLFGTVWGIMDALMEIGDSGSTGLETIAGPVGEALIATGLGIAVAVPAVLIYNFLVRRMKAGVHAMNDFAQDFYALCQQTDFQTPEAAFRDDARNGWSNTAQVGA